MSSFIALSGLACIAGLAFIATLMLTPIVRLGAKRLGIVDRPDGHRKLHRREIPLGGGMAILAGLALVLGALLVAPSPARDVLLQNQRFLIGLALSSCVICAIGLVDDRIGLRGRHKLAGQIVAAGILMLHGFKVQTLQFQNWEVDLGLLAVPFTLLWLLTTINALNLIDGMDGLATSVGIVLSVAIAWVAFLQGHAFDALSAAMIAGSLSGFLYYNFPPARMFLGDAGSMLIGLLLGTLAMRCSFEAPANAGIAVPVALWAIPLFDVAMAILRRKLTGRSVFTTDRGHLHHCLLQRGYGCRTALFTIASLCVSTAAACVISVVCRNDLIAASAALGVPGLMVAARFFGDTECSLLFRRLHAFARSFLPFQHESAGQSRQICTHLQGLTQWDELWKTLTAYAERFDLTAVQLNVNVPSIHEEYHASWNRKTSRDETRLCDTEIPLLAQDRTVGRIKITVDPMQRDSMCDWMSELIAGLKPFESHLVSLLTEPLRANAVQEVTASAPLSSRPTGRRTPRPAEIYAAPALAAAGIDAARR